MSILGKFSAGNSLRIKAMCSCVRISRALIPQVRFFAWARISSTTAIEITSFQLGLAELAVKFHWVDGYRIAYIRGSCWNRIAILYASYVRCTSVVGIAISLYLNPVWSGSDGRTIYHWFDRPLWYVDGKWWWCLLWIEEMLCGVMPYLSTAVCTELPHGKVK